MELISHRKIEELQSKIFSAKNQEDLDNIAYVDTMFDGLSLILDEIELGNTSKNYEIFSEWKNYRDSWHNVLVSENRINQILDELECIYKNDLLTAQQMKSALKLTLELKAAKLEGFSERYRKVFLIPIQRDIPIGFLSLIIDEIYYELFLDDFDKIFTSRLDENFNLQSLLMSIFNHDLYGKKLDIQVDNLSINVVSSQGDRSGKEILKEVFSKDTAGKDVYSYLVFLSLNGFFSKIEVAQIKEHFLTKGIPLSRFQELLDQYEYNLFKKLPNGIPPT